MRRKLAAGSRHEHGMDLVEVGQLIERANFDCT
jgi:hypothetical protein